LSIIRPPYDALRVLDAACRRRNYTLAGEELGVSHSAVSQTIRRLELAYGQKMFRRIGNQMSPTDAAVTLAEAFRGAEHMLLGASRKVTAARREPTLVLSTLPSIAKLWLVSRLSRLADAMPDVSVEVRTSRDLANFDADGVDVALRVGRGDWPDVRAEFLFNEHLFPVCSPEFLARRRTLVEPSLARAPLIFEDVDLWPAWFTAAGVQPPSGCRGPAFDDSTLTVEAAAAGLCVALVRHLHAQEALAAGRLVRISPIEVPDPNSCYLVWREDNPRISAIRRFSDWVLAECDREGLLQAA
jgi:LysR family glycine cleavage system transcriptional activator